MKKLVARLNSPLAAVAITAAVYLVFLALRLDKHNHDFSYFVTAGDLFSDSQSVVGNLNILKDSAGYDGQFYYRLALDPFTGKPTDFGITLDNPPNRHSRIGYPLLIWLFSLGQPSLVPTIMVALNYVTLCWLAWVSARYAQFKNRHALWGIVFALYAGFLLTLSRDLTEIVQIGFLFTALLLLQRGRILFAALCFTLAVLVKETTLLAVLAILLAALIESYRQTPRRAPLDRRIGWLLLPFGVYGVWQLVLRIHWGEFPLSVGSRLVGLPLAALIPFVQSISPPTDSFQRLWLIELLFMGVFTVAVLVALRASTAELSVKLIWLLYTCFALSWSRLIWVEDWAFLRHLSEVFVFGAIILLGSRLRFVLPIGVASILLWLYVASEVLRMF